MTQPVVFISYSHKDEADATRYYRAALQVFEAIGVTAMADFVREALARVENTDE